MRKSRLRHGAMIEGLEGRQLLTVYPVNNASDFLIVNNANLEPGDIVEFGNVTGTLSLTAEDSGTAANPVVITSLDSSTGSPIDPNAPVASRSTLSSGNGVGINVTDAGGIKVVGLNVVGSGRTVNTTSGIVFNNDQAGNTKIDSIIIDHVDVTGYKLSGISVGGSVGKSGFSNVAISNCHVYDVGNAGIETHGVFNATSTLYANTNVSVTNCVVNGITGIAGWNNHSGDGILLSDVDGALIDHSEAFNNGALNTHEGGPVGIWVWDANAATIQYCSSHDNKTNSKADGGGFDLDGGTTNSVIQYCYSANNAGAGYGVFQFSGARPFGNNVVRYNISDNDGRKNNYAGIQVWNGSTASSFSGTDIYGNSVRISLATGSTAALRLQTDAARVRIFNNIFTASGGALTAWVQPSSTPGITVVGNDYWNYSGTVTFKLGAKVNTGFSAWTNAGYEKQSGVIVGKNVNPFFANSAGGSAAAFMLQSTSTLLDAGLNPFSVFGIDPGTQDYFGNSLPQGAGYAMGAYEG